MNAGEVAQVSWNLEMRFCLGKTVLGKFEEEEQYEDILLMIQLLTHILARDYLAFFDGKELVLV